MSINNLPVWLRFNLVFGLLFILLLVAGGAGLWGTTSLTEQITSAIKSDGQISERIAEVATNSLGLRRYEKDIFLNITKQEKATGYFKKWQAENQKLMENIGELEKLVYLPEEEQMIVKMKRGAEAYQKGFSGIYNDISAGKLTTPQDGNKAMKAFKPAIRDLTENSSAIHGASTERMHKMTENVLAVEGRVNIVIILVLAVSVLLLALFAFLLTRSITSPLGQVKGMLAALSNGDLEQRLKLSRKDELGDMARTLDRFTDDLQSEVLTAFENIADGKLHVQAKGFVKDPLARANATLSDLISQILQASDQINSGSVQVADSSQTLSQGATESAASIEEISASMTEMAEQTTASAENANQANIIAEEARKAADTGSHRMGEMIEAMGEINESGENISKIIKTIDEIAFQTNLLALNAAVEAARAGQHGKGFAVVAEEVRNLAARSAKAASETAELIEGSVAKASNGTQIAERTSDALTQIVASITKVSDLVGEIATANNEQALGISQVTQGLAQIDNVIQQNTASAEESAATSEELASQSEHLQQLLRRFQLADGKTPVITSRPKVASSPTKKVTTPQAPKPAAESGWGDAVKAPQIKLDDSEFGKY